MLLVAVGTEVDPQADANLRPGEMNLLHFVDELRAVGRAVGGQVRFGALRGDHAGRAAATPTANASGAAADRSAGRGEHRAAREVGRGGPASTSGDGR